ncbi:hypothetical protein E2C01_043564 [Portunus trituberculatus]|uniref:Uncharacterized protein n=1 Tax=Portunus trituberculatus TaxID=210409 RepID=A0A5B7FXN7_PORTR|nr:hypothetical protein [Portunus trituberculatus]
MDAAVPRQYRPSTQPCFLLMTSAAHAGYPISYCGSPPAKKPLPRVRKPNLHSDRGQDSNTCAWRPLGSQSTHGSTVRENDPKV